MFKNIYKITPYLDESRVDLDQDRRKRNYRLKNKVVYLLDQTILYSLYDNIRNYIYYYKCWCKYLYCVNYNNKLYRKKNMKKKLIEFYI